MNLIFTFSLEQRALATVAVTLWSLDDVRDLMSKYALHILHNNWLEIEKVVIQKSFKLQLPERLKEKLLGFVMRVGLQLISWVEVHHRMYKFVRVLPATFVWTSLGTINNIRTAKLLVLGGTLDNYISFALACMYCLVEEIKYCWNMFDLSLRRSKFKDISIALYWFDYMSKLHIEELSKSYTPLMYIPHRSFLKEAIQNGNEVATRYFFKVNVRDGEAFLIASAKSVAVQLNNAHDIVALQRYSGVMMFLFTKMNTEQQADVIENYTYAFLKCFLVWPLHSLFFETVIKDKWNSICKNEFSNLLPIIAFVMRWEHNLNKFFEEFWQQSPETCKQFVTDQGDIIYLLIGLCKAGDKENFKLVLKDILKMGSKPIFAFLISSEKWNSIKFLIKKGLSTKGGMRAFRDVFNNHVHKLLSRKNFWKEDCSKFQYIKEYQVDKLFQLVHGCIFEYNRKRRRTTYNNTSSKNH